MWAELFEMFQRENVLHRIVNNPLGQFGPRAMPYLGARLLPEKLVYDNEFKQVGMRFRSVVANLSAQHSPAQLKGSVVTRGQDVSLAYFNIGNEFNAEHMVVVNKILAAAGKEKAGAEAQIRLLDWMKAALADPHTMIMERMRWQAIVDAQISVTGDNGATYTTEYENPSGHRFSATQTWSDDNEDPMTDISAGVDILTSKGYTLAGVYSGSVVNGLMRGNDEMKARAGVLSIVGGVTAGLPGNLDKATLDSIFTRDGLPPVTEYNALWYDQTTSGFMLDRDVMVLVGATPRSEFIENNDDSLIQLDNTLGYSAIGTVSTELMPGKVTNLVYQNERIPNSIYGESFMAGLPIITDPEAIVVITDIE